MIDSPSLRERLPDSALLAVAGGIAAALLVLATAAFTRTARPLNDAAWDRIATALADEPLSPALLVVRTDTRTGDWKVAAAVQRLDSAGAAAVGVAVDLSTPVAPTGGMADVLASAPHAIIGVTMRSTHGQADTVAWPWFLTGTAVRDADAAGRLGRTTLLRDADGVVRASPVTRPGETWLVRALAQRLGGVRAANDPGPSDPLVRFARTDTLWHGARTLSLDSVLALDGAALQMAVAGGVALVGIDDGSTVPTSVGALPPLAIMAHDVHAAHRVATGAVPAIRPAGVALCAAWLLVWIVAGSVIAAHWSMRRTLGAAVAGVVALAAHTLWLADAHGVWLPLGSGMLAWLTALAGAEAVRLWQARRQQRLTTLLFSRFVTPALAGEAWRDRHLYLQGGRPAPLQLPVTVLFADLRGFTRFSESNDAGAVMRLITDVTAACAADIAAHGGLVDDFAGDGIKADFGAPVPRTAPADVARDAANAVACAQALAVTIARLLPASLGRDGTQARIGIHSGTAVAGTVGGGTRLKYTVVGDVVNVAARLQSVDLPGDASAATPCRIVVSAATMALLGASVPPAEDLGALSLSGRAAPVPAYRLLPRS